MTHFGGLNRGETGLEPKKRVNVCDRFIGARQAACSLELATCSGRIAAVKGEAREAHGQASTMTERETRDLQNVRQQALH